MTVRDKLRDINVRLVELATYLKLSRPTIYKYLELFEEGDFGKIEDATCAMFRYIDETPQLTKPALMNYLINNILPTSQVLGENYVSKVAEAIKALKESNKPEDQEKLAKIENMLFGSKLEK